MNSIDNFFLDYKHLCLALIFITHIKIKIERNYVLLHAPHQHRY